MKKRFVFITAQRKELRGGNMKKRRLMLCSIVSLIMVFVMAVPMTVSAAETKVAGDATALTKAITEAKDGDTIKLTASFAASITIPDDKNITLDLNGKTLTGDKDHTITNAGVLTVIDSGNGGKIVNNDGAKGTLFNKPGAQATLKGGTFTGNTWYVIKNLGSLTIQAGTTVTQNDAGSSSIDNGWYDATKQNGNDCGITHSGTQTANLVIAGGEFSGGMNTIKNDDYGILKISDGTFSNTDGPTVLNWNVAEISGGSFTVNSPANAILANGGTNDTADKGELAITGGEFIANNNGNGVLFTYGIGAQKGKGTVTIKNGTFKGSLAITQDYPYTPEISGGEFTDDPAKYVAEGKVAIKFVRANKDGNYYVGTQKEIQKIANTAKDGDTIDVIKGSITLDMTTPGVNVNNDQFNEGEVRVNDTTLEPGTGMKIQNPATDPTKPSQDQTQKPSDTAKADKSAKTGDDFNLFAVGGVALAAIIAMAAVAITGRRHRQR